jgi:hypothetical protein
MLKVIFSLLWLSTANAAGVNQIGYIGCSNTMMSVQGYHGVGGNKFWPQYNTSSGAIQFWAQTSQNQFWGGYVTNIFNYSQPLIVWAQLCENVNSYAPTDYAHVTQMLTNLRRLSPGATVYVSAINSYNPVGMCVDMGPTNQGYTDSVAWRDQAVADGLASLGPDMGPLTLSPPLVVSDKCHPSTTGMQFLGNQLKTFFDGL